MFNILCKTKGLICWLSIKSADSDDRFPQTVGASHRRFQLLDCMAEMPRNCPDGADLDLPNVSFAMSLGRIRLAA